MFSNHSPWLSQMKSSRTAIQLAGNLETDIAVVGAGIAGVSTAYFLLRDTDKRIILLDARKVAQGATGHNAGQLVSYFERPFSGLVEEFGLEMAAHGQQEVESAWELIDEMIKEANLKTPLSIFKGYAGCTDILQLIGFLQNNLYREQAGLHFEKTYIAEDAKGLDKIPERYQHLYTLVPREHILSVPETDNDYFLAALPTRKGCMNSALFTEEVVAYLLARYPSRLTLAEHSPVRRIHLHPTYGVLDTDSYTVTASRVVLCTNGFENFTITNDGQELDTKFHHLVRGSVGYMAGYLEQSTHHPMAVSYLPEMSSRERDIYFEKPYFYVTRRPFINEEGQALNLVCAGGPEELVEDSSHYSRTQPYSQTALEEIDRLLRQNYRHMPKDKLTYMFFWHGLLGYTPNGIRVIGPEPINPVLLYNLGCNGVGLLPSIYGGKKIALILNGAKPEKSIFDPGNQKE